MTQRNRGLDLGRLTAASDEELNAFKQYYADTLGHRHIGLEYMLAESPRAMKLYRRYSDVATPGNYEENRKLFVFGFLPYYAVLGYAVGVRYLIHTRQRMGMSKQQILDGVNVSSIVHGPAGMETIARALVDYEWLTPEQPAEFPDGWSADYGKIASGLDFDTPGVSKAELRSLEEWYLAVPGEVPGHVSFLAAHRPELLKAYRQRFEQSLSVLPVQFLPTTLLHYAAIRLSPAGIRENLLLAKGLGVSKDTALQVLGSASLNGAMDTFDLVNEVAADVFEGWA